MNEQPSAAGYRCGFAAIVGRPNVGKSTLLNALLGQKLSIVSPKPQTTRHRILGILTRPAAQMIFVDTPGLHAGARRAMNRHMNRAALASLQDADVNVFVVEALRWTDEDQRVLDELRQAGAPDHPGAEQGRQGVPEGAAAAVHRGAGPARAFRRDRAAVGAEGQQRRAAARRPSPATCRESPPHFPEDQLTDRSKQFQAAEIVREKLTLRLRQELPYGMTVVIEQFKEEDGRLLINAVIWVERSGQKAIVIGNGGEQLKEVGRAARLEMVELFKLPGAPGVVGEGEGKLVGQRDRSAAAGLRDVSDPRRVQLQPAFVLHHRPYRDTSRILELFTRDHGRVSVFARGARSARKAGTALTSILQPFNRLLVSWSGRGEAGQLTGAEFDGAMSSLPPDRS